MCPTPQELAAGKRVATMQILLITANALRLDDGRRWHETHAKYAYAATTLTTLAALVPPETDIILVSDHGFGPLHSDVYINQWLSARGWLRFRSQSASGCLYLY